MRVTLLDAPNLVALIHYQLLQGAAVLLKIPMTRAVLSENEGTG